MSVEKKYYWLKLKRDFFKRHDITVIESMQNGGQYLLFYMKLLVESIDHEGALRFSDTVPYNDTMLSAITHTDIDIVRSAVKVFQQFGMMDMLDDGTLFMNQVETMIGDETNWAEKKRLYREKQKELGTNVGKKRTLSDKSIELEIRDKSIDKEQEVKTTDFDTFYTAYPKKEGKKSAQKAFNALIKKGVTLDDMLSRLHTYQNQIAVRRTDMQYVKLPASFLNALEDYEPSAPKPAQIDVKPVICAHCGGIVKFGTCLQCGTIYGPDGKEVVL